MAVIWCQECDALNELTASEVKEVAQPLHGALATKEADVPEEG